MLYLKKTDIEEKENYECNQSKEMPLKRKKSNQISLSKKALPNLR